MTIKSLPGIAIAWLLLFGVGCAPPASGTNPSKTAEPHAAATPDRDAPPAADRLLALMRERLLVMHDVARWKWNAKRPIADPEREQALLADLERRGAEYGLAPDDARRFMRAQIEAGKLVQQADWRRWEADESEAFANALDLQTELRPKIDRLSEQLLAAYAELRPQLAEFGERERFARRAEQILAGEGIDERVRAKALGKWNDDH